MSAEKTCNWSQNDFDDVDCSVWHTDCKNSFCLSDGSPLENDMHFCCYCGKALTERHFTPEVEDAQ